MGETVTAKPAKKPHGRPKNEPKVAPEEIPDIAATTNGYRQLSKATGISDHDAKVFKRVAKLTAEEWQEKAYGQMRDIVSESLVRLKTKLDDMSGAQLAVATGILCDKLKDSPKATQNLHLHLTSGDRDEVLKALLGKHAERIFDAKTPEPKVVAPATNSSAGPVIDLEPGPVLHTGDS